MSIEQGRRRTRQSEEGSQGDDVHEIQNASRAGHEALLALTCLLARIRRAARQAAPSGPTRPILRAAGTPQTDQAKPSLEIYGFAMLDIGHDFKQIDPDWFDTMRVTKLPSVANQFGEDNNTFAGVRQSGWAYARRRPLRSAT
jgi:hypothetical protein